jgi:tRNA threonylcarbamoyladenosine biosynthesis protein TsaE
MLKFEPESEEQQERLGAALANCAPVSLIIYLIGDLGAGKTTLVRGFMRGLGYRGTVKSPTYTLIEPYSIGGRSICHLDLYRLADAEELEYLGVRDLLQEETVLLIEWPERGEGVLPTADLTILISHREQGRDVGISAQSGSGERVMQRLDASLARIASG